MNRMLVVGLLTLVVGGCGKSGEGGGGAADPSLDKYANTDLASAMTQLMASRHAVHDLKADHINDEGMADYLRMRVTERAIPTMDAFLAEAAKVTPPALLADAHARLVEIAKEERAALGELSAALNPVSASGWTAGHEKLMAATERAARWESGFTTELAKSGIKLAPITPAKYPDQLAEPVEQPKGPCKGKPCPCEDGSEKIESGVLLECVLTQEKAVGELVCAPGKLTFRPDGSFESCESALLFVPFELTPDTPKDQVPVCGGGRITRGPDGKVTACVLVSDLKAGDATLPKGSAVVFDGTGIASLAP